jgi:hypothetical protein
MEPSSAHAWWADACVVLLHYSTIVGPTALGKAAEMMEKLANKSVDRPKHSKFLGNFGK